MLRCTRLRAAPPAVRRAFMDVVIGTRAPQRITFDLFARRCPRAVDNFVKLCTGELVLPRVRTIDGLDANNYNNNNNNNNNNSSSGGRSSTTDVAAAEGELASLHTTPAFADAFLPQLTYRNSLFHRVHRGFCVQGGDVVSDRGVDQLSIYGETYEAPDEVAASVFDARGLVGTAVSAPHLNGAQFFILTAASAPHLNGTCICFGRVASGWHVVEAMEQVELAHTGMPAEAIRIVDCGNAHGLAGGEAARSYSPRVLVGNWYEERQVQHDCAQLYATRLAQQHASQQQQQEQVHAALLQPNAALASYVAPHHTYKQQCTTHVSQSTRSAETTATRCCADVVRFGEALYIATMCAGGVLSIASPPSSLSASSSSSSHAASNDVAVMVAPLHGGDGGHSTLTTATASMTASAADTWLLQRARDENGAAYTSHLHEGDVLHYGQRVLLVRNVRDDARGYRCLRSRLCSIGESMPRLAATAAAAQAQQQQQQPVTASLGVGADGVFVVARPGTRRGAAEVDGAVVRYGEAVVLLHAATNKPLQHGMAGSEAAASATASRRRCTTTATGAVCCGYAASDTATRQHTRALAAVATSPANMFRLLRANVGRRDGDIGGAVASATRTAPSATTLPKATALSTYNHHTTADNDNNDNDKQSENVVTSVLSRLRAGAAALGGRLGLRPLALALGVACAETARTLLTRAQLHAAVASLGVTLLPVEHDVLRTRFDGDGDGVVCAQALMDELRGTLSSRRHTAVMHAYAQLLVEGDGAVTFAQMRALYAANARSHVDVRAGRATAAEVMRAYDACMPGPVIGDARGVVRVATFVAYHAEVSLAYADDDEFVAMVQSCWRVPSRDAYVRARPRRHVVVEYDNGEQCSIDVPDSFVLPREDTPHAGDECYRDHDDNTKSDNNNNNNNNNNSSVVVEEAVRRLLVQHGVRNVKHVRLEVRSPSS